MRTQFPTSDVHEEPPAVTPSELTFPVVGIGASAGGIVALTRFFEQIDGPTGMAFVVIMHLAPNHESNLAALLQRVTTLTVQQVTERMLLEPDHVYVIPPNGDLNMDDGHIGVSEPTRIGGPHVAVDLFLRTLADAHTDRAFAIILSGLGSDGALGVRRINERGGVTFAQLPSDAEFDSMPRAAIATGLVDLVLPVSQMPARLRELWTNIQAMRLPTGAALSHPVRAAIDTDEEQAAESALRDTLALLHKRTRHDFRHYKRATVLRRLERRLQVNAMPNLVEYREYLDRHPAETSALLQDMLISVTSFFRDPEAFMVLEERVIAALFEGRGGADVVRVWIPACATGEEAYSIAILLREHLETLVDPPLVQIFATDIDERAIAVGRAGLYSEGIANDVSPNRLRRFFQKEGDRFRVIKSIRESVLFAVHNVLRDPPFSRLDLISCRNLLIYLDRDAQKGIIETFRFAFTNGGYLMLGISESMDAANDTFDAFDKKHRIFEVRPAARASRSAVAAAMVAGLSIPPPPSAERKRPSSVTERHQWALERYATPSVLIDARQQILHMTHGASAFFVRSSGMPTHDLIANTQPELRAEMSTAVFRALQTREPATMRGVLSGADGIKRRVVIEVQAFHDDDVNSDFALVTLHQFDEAVPRDLAGTGTTGDGEVARQLETEIAQLKSYLQDTIERSETSTEELRASNEELQAINEELRSASEELETSREELQSINEELTTVNYELKSKVEETIQINDDLQNLIASTDFAVVFVDAHMRIKRFTPRATELFNLIPGDVGRSLLDITHRLRSDTITQDAEEAFRSLRAIERETVGSDGRHYLCRVTPYRTTDNKIEGAVMTFVDITSRVQAEQKAGENVERLRIATETVRHYAIISLDEHGTIVTWNAGARAAFGYEEGEAIGQPIAALFTPEDRAGGVHLAELERARTTGAAEDERWHVRKDGTRFYASGVMTAYMSGGMPGFAKILRDMTGTKMIDARRDEELNRQKQAGIAAETANRMKDEFLAVMSHELKHPLNLIHVNAELLSRMPEVSEFPKVKRAADTIRRTVAGQARIIDDLLDLSRARTGKMTMTHERTSLRELVARIVDAARRDAEAKGIALTTTIDADDLVVACDPVRFEQITWNLLSNAIKFTAAGGSVTVRLERAGSEVLLEVSDTGRGIAPAFIVDIFSMFRQEHRDVVGGEGGMGIGLALVKELTEAQGGRVAVHSDGVGKGATFVVAMPADDGLPAAANDGGETSSGPLAGLRVLAVDDSADALEPFAELLRLEGAIVTETHGAAEALAQLGRQPFDLMISDVGMPGMDGYELMAQVRQRNGIDTIAAIAMSGYGRADDVQRATEAGFDAHLTKPASIDDCARLVVQLRERGRLP